MNKILDMQQLKSAWRPLGRTVLRGSSLYFDYTCAGFELALCCRGVVTATANWSGKYGKIGVSIDGGELRQLSLQSGENKLVLAHGLQQGEHIIRIEKLSEASRAAARFDNIGFDGEAGKAPKPKQRRFFAVGDSLTAGLWNETYSREIHEELDEQGFYQDGSKTYAALAAAAFDMDYTAVALSGWGLVIGYGNYPQNNVPRVLDCTIPFGDESEKWDWEKDFADVVLINLTTNDSCVFSEYGGIPSKEDFLAAAKKLTGKLRGHFPDAPIIWANGFSGLGAYEDEIKEAVSGDNMYYLVLPCNQDGGQWHPTLSGNKTAAEVLIQKLKEIEV